MGREGLHVAPSTISGRGVFAARRFAPGELIEQCEVLRVPATEVELVQRTVLRDYLFSCDDGSGDVAIALGLGSLYNHSDDANAEYAKDAANNLVTITARRDIAIGDEVTVPYQRVWLMDGRREGTEAHGPYLGPSRHGPGRGR
jgi:SET domain-containing protein